MHGQVSELQAHVHAKEDSLETLRGEMGTQVRTNKILLEQASAGLNQTWLECMRKQSGMTCMCEQTPPCLAIRMTRLYCTLPSWLLPFAYDANALHRRCIPADLCSFIDDGCANSLPYRAGCAQDGCRGGAGGRQEYHPEAGRSAAQGKQLAGAGDLRTARCSSWFVSIAWSLL